MFEQTFVQTGKTNKGWTVVLSTVIQLFIIGIFVLMPMIYFDVLPAARCKASLWRRRRLHRRRRRRRSSRRFRSCT